MQQFIQNGDGMDIAFDDRIMEKHFGDWQGMTVKEIKQKHAIEWKEFNDKMNYAPPGDGAESMQKSGADWAESLISSS